MSENINLSLESLNLTYESTVLPRRNSDSGPQPSLAFVELFVAGKTITFNPPQYVIDLDFNRLGDSGSTLILNVFDKNWEDLEILFSYNFSDVQIRYGIIGGVVSKVYNLQLTDYNINFNTAGALLTIKGISVGAVENLKPITLDTETINPTEAAKKICKKAGWIVENSNFQPSEDIVFSNKDTIALLSEHPATYIKNHLAPIAIRKSDGESGYSFYLDDTTKPSTAYFGIRDVIENAHKTYVYMKGIDSPVIDLNLSINGVFGGSTTDMVSTEVEANFIDPQTKEIVSLSKDINSVRTTVTGEYSHTNSKQSKKVVDAAGASKSQMNALLNYRMTSTLPYTGNMVIRGDPTVEVTDVIRLIIVTDKGNLHHCSGLYLVLEVNDRISNGVMTTTVNIVGDADIEQGIEVINYRSLLK